MPFLLFLFVILFFNLLNHLSFFLYTNNSIIANNAKYRINEHKAIIGYVKNGIASNGE